MEPLIFLTVRSVANGVKRALTSTKRLIGLIGVILYYVWMIMRPFTGSSRNAFSHPPRPLIDMPSLAMIDAVVFWAFALITFFMLISMGQRSMYRPADVDVLFPTPVNPKYVLLFRLLRDYLVTLLLPFFFMIFLYRPATDIGVVIRNFPKEQGLVFRSALAAWFLVAMGWVCLQYAVSLSINRSDLQSDRNKKILSWGMGSFGLALVASIAYLGSRIETMDQFIAFSHLWPYRVIFFTATLASTVVTGAVQGNLIFVFSGLLGLVATILAGLWFALRQVGYMYDQAAAQGFGKSATMALQRKGDLIGIVAEQARSGKIKVSSRWYHKLNVPGPRALVWKEVIVQNRSTGKFTWLLAPVVIFLAVTPALAPSRHGLSGILLLLMLGMGVFLSGMANMQSGFIELLRRVDLEKPLPFSPASIVFWEIVAKGFAPTVMVLLGAGVATAVNPGLWPYALASIIAMPTLGVLMASAIFLVIILFPDVDDPTQRSFRGLMTLLGLVILCSPGIGIFALLGIFVHPAVAAVFWAAANLGITVVVSMVGGGLYGQFNPSE